MARIQVLITAGGTQERIDAVRSISNTGTGRLGCLTAECFASFPQVERVLYIAGKNAVIPATQKAQIFRIEGTDRKSVV
jgi:phosphopantothenate-cysteine ligase